MLDDPDLGRGDEAKAESTLDVHGRVQLVTKPCENATGFSSRHEAESTAVASENPRGNEGSRSNPPSENKSFLGLGPRSQTVYRMSSSE